MSEAERNRQGEGGATREMESAASASDRAVAEVAEGRAEGAVDMQAQRRRRSLVVAGRRRLPADSMLEG